MFNLKQFRLAIAKLSQAEFARKVGVATGTIGKIEANHQKISDKMLQRISDAFNIDLEEYKSYAVDDRNIVNDTEQEYDSIWKDKYYALLEKYNACLEEKANLGQQDPDKK